MSTIAREPPRSTMSITDQKTMMVMRVIIPMMMKGKRSEFFSEGMNR